MKLKKIPVLIGASIFLVSASDAVNAQTPGEILIAEILAEIALAIENLAPAQACRAETTTVSKGLKSEAANPDRSMAEGAARRMLVDKAWNQADASCKEMVKADGTTQCNVKKGNLDLKNGIKLDCKFLNNAWGCDAELTNDVTYVCNT